MIPKNQMKQPKQVYKKKFRSSKDQQYENNRLPDKQNTFKII